MKALLVSVLLIFTGCMSIQKQNTVIFEPVALPATYSFQLPPHTREVSIPVSANVQLSGLLHERQNHKYLMIYFQGNAKNLQNWLDNHRMALDWGYNLLVTDYRGFGKSGGKLNGQAHMYSDAEKVYDYAIGLGYKPENILLYGYSMGTAMAAHVATVRKARALILESPYSSIPEITWVGNKTPAYELPTKQKAQKITIPTMIIHGDKDEVISVDHGQRVYDHLATPQKQLVVIEGGAHGNLRQRPEYKGLITSFVRKYE